jgi:cell division protein FtsW (lipid II flippase)
MDSGARGILLGVAVAFIVIFTGMTIAALATAQLNFASILAFGLSFLVIGTVLFGLIGAIRNPPDDHE